MNCSSLSNLCSNAFGATGILLLSYCCVNVNANSFYQGFTNEAIVKQAMSYEKGQHAGQCKAFVQAVVDAVGGSLGTGYRDCYLQELMRTGGFEVFKMEDVTSGCIGQLSNDNDPTDDSHTHSFIVLKNLGGGVFQTIHSNYHFDENVSIDTWNPYTIAQCPSNQMMTS